MAKIVLDANALMMPFQFRVNLDAELKRLVGDSEIFVPSSVVNELRHLSKGSRVAKAALELSKKYELVEVETKGDEAVIEVAASLRATVVTNDARLLAILKEQGIPRIRLRSRNHLVMEES